MPKDATHPQRRQHAKYERLIEAAKVNAPLPTAVAHPCDATSLAGTLEAYRAGLIIPILVGPADKIRKLAKAGGVDIAGVEIVDAPHSQAAAEKSVALVREGKAELLMKGSLHSDELLAAVTKRETGLRTGRRVSHVFIMDVPTHPQTLFITDAAVNIAPDLMAKRDIVQNAIDLYRALGLGTPKVADTFRRRDRDGRHPLHHRGRRAVQDGRPRPDHRWRAGRPAGFRQCHQPGGGRDQRHQVAVAGQAQILVVPDLEAGNMLAKNLSFLSKADAAGIVLGARVPVILTSRADNVRTRLASCAVASLLAHNRRSVEPIRT